MEDDPATRVALRELLDDAGYAPTEAADGETALEALSAGAYDLLLLTIPLLLFADWAGRCARSCGGILAPASCRSCS